MHCAPPGSTAALTSSSTPQSATAPIQGNLNLPLVALSSLGTPPHNPALRPRLQQACLNVLGLLYDHQAHSRHEVERVGGNRYAARIGELRDAGHPILGPRKSPRHGIYETEPMQDGQEMYRLPAPAQQREEAGR